MRLPLLRDSDWIVFGGDGQAHLVPRLALDTGKVEQTQGPVVDLLLGKKNADPAIRGAS